MGHPKALIGLWILIVAFASTGCTYVVLQLREPGHRNKAFPEAVASEYHCDKRPLPFFQFEENELVPNRIEPGAEFNQRLIYVLCPQRPTAVIPGTLRTRVLFEGQTILEDEVEEKLRPGRWVLDSFVTLPETAAPGLYAMDVTFESGQGQLHSQIAFVVESAD